MKKTRLFAVAAMLTASTCAFAQFSNVGGSSKGAGMSINTDNYRRFEVSFASTTESYTDNDDDYNLSVSESYKGASASLIWGTSITPSIPLFLEYGADFTWNTETGSDYDYDVDYRYTRMSVAVPINLAYKVSFSNNADFSIVPFVGLNFKVNIVAKEKVEAEDGSYKVSSSINYFDKKDVGNDTANRFQLGMNLGIGFNYKKLYVGYRFQPDFMEFMEDIKTKTNYVSVGINF